MAGLALTLRQPSAARRYLLSMDGFSYSNLWDSIVAADPCDGPTPVNYQVPGGVSFADSITILLNCEPVDISETTFYFAAKKDVNLPDTDPSVIQFSWQGQNVLDRFSRLTGLTYLQLSAEQTTWMLSQYQGAWYYQVRMLNSDVITQIQSGVITIAQPVFNSGGI
jgi:hypothetical protein